MSFKELETVVLDRDLPKHGLRRGDLGPSFRCIALTDLRWSS